MVVLTVASAMVNAPLGTMVVMALEAMDSLYGIEGSYLWRVVQPCQALPAAAATILNSASLADSQGKSGQGRNLAASSV